MVDNNWLVQHAVKNVWCDPSLDGRLTMQLARIGDVGGETYGMRVSEYSIKLPKENIWYQVYQIGNLSVDYVGIPQLWDGWSNLANVINEYGISIKIYDGGGITYPSELIWIRQLNNDNVILAIEPAENQIDLVNTPIFISFYDGEFRHTPEFTTDYNNSVINKVVHNQIDLENIFRIYQAEKLKQGDVQAYVNGVPVFDLNNQTAKAWDRIELVRDGLVKETHLFKVADLPTFASIVDKQRKYLLHPNKGCDYLEFNNDVEIFIFNGLQGRYYPIHTTASVRQVTHHDFSIPVANIQDLRNSSKWDNLDNITIKLNIRHSGMHKKLIYERTQLLELYKLPDRSIINAMVGYDATIPDWQAANLENSFYCRLMASRYYNIDKQLCTDVYGYDAATKYVSDVPVKINTDGTFTMPPLTSGKVTVYEYDTYGAFLGSNTVEHTVSKEYRPANPKCGMIEPIIGVGSATPTIYYGPDNFVLEGGINYRFYKSLNKDGVNTFKGYIDITDSDEYSIDPDTHEVVWHIDRDRFTPTIVSDATYVDYQGDFSVVDTGVIDLTVRADVSLDRDIPHCPKVIDLFLGDVLLIPEVDYHVAWPRIVIYSKERLIKYTKSMATVRLRAIGLAAEYTSPKHGFVIDGILSNNTRFDLRDSKVTRLIVDGKLKHRDDVIFRENSTVGMDGLINGQPYVVNDTMIPLRNLITYDKSIYELKSADNQYSDVVEEYLSVFIPQVPTVEHNPIPQRYRTFSPILNKVIFDLTTGLLVPNEDILHNNISTAQFDAIMAPYTPLLDFDPIRLNVDDNYVVTEPHVYTTKVQLTPLQFSLIERINDRYLGNKVVLNKLITIKE